jgi:hypothetical protein
LGIVLSHTVLFDPFERFWSAQFFAPAWWFIPAILLAYCFYPVVLSAARRAGGIPLLAVAAMVNTIAYRLSDVGVLQKDTWYFIVLQESFNFSLGVVAGLAWNSPQRIHLERILFAPAAFAIAFVLFAAGNVANWSPEARPIASFLYGPALVVMLAVISKRIERSRLVRITTKVDPYDLYLVHQPFAFPLALAGAFVFRDYTVFAGWFIFLFVAAAAALVFAAAQRFVFGWFANDTPFATGVVSTVRIGR